MTVKSVALAMVLLLLSFGSEAKLCETRITSPLGWCKKDGKCVAMCVVKGFSGGFCKGLIHRYCMCTKICNSVPHPLPSPSPPPPPSVPSPSLSPPPSNQHGGKFPMIQDDLRVMVFTIKPQSTQGLRSCVRRN